MNSTGSRVTWAGTAVVASVLFCAPPARSAGMYAGDIGVRTLARGGANIVHPDDVAAPWLNPAAMTLGSGIALHLDLNLVFLTSSFLRTCGGIPEGCGPKDPVSRTYRGFDGSDRTTRVEGNRPATSDNVVAPEVGQLGNLGTPSRFDGTTAVSNEAGIQPVPRVALVIHGDTVGLPGFAASAYVMTPNNGDYAFGAEQPTRYTLIARDLAEAYFGVAAGYRVSDVLAVGLGFQAVSVGLLQSVRLSADQYGNEDPTWDIEVKIGAQQHLIPSGNAGVWMNPGRLLGLGDVEVGASVQLGRQVRARGPVALVGFGENIQQFIDDGLVNIAVAKDAAATAEFAMPAVYRVGVRTGAEDLTHDGKNTVAFNVEGAFVYEGWSVLDHILLSTRGVTSDLNPSDNVPGTELAPLIQPKDWNDAWSARLGGTLALLNRMIEVHAGGFFETSAIPNSTYTVEFVDGDKIGVGGGLSVALSGVRLDVGYNHIHAFDRTVGTESIVFNGSAGPSILVDGETRTRVAMGTYIGMFDMVNVAMTVGIDDVLGLKGPR